MNPVHLGVHQLNELGSGRWNLLGRHRWPPWVALPPYPIHPTGELSNRFDSTTKTISKPTMLPLETEIQDQKHHIA
jgi:hypothetical protein